MFTAIRGAHDDLERRSSALSDALGSLFGDAVDGDDTGDLHADIFQEVIEVKPSIEETREVLGRFLKRRVLSPEMFRNENGRPALVSAEGELLENDLFEPLKVSQLLRDTRNPSDPAGLVRSRRNNPAEALQLLLRG